MSERFVLLLLTFLPPRQEASNEYSTARSKTSAETEAWQAYYEVKLRIVAQKDFDGFIALDTLSLPA
jgi:hypothetical protein